MDHQTVSERSLDTRMSARAGAPARAVVSARGVDTHYLRAGSGEAVVLLTQDHGDDGAYAAFASLARNARVIAPYVPAKLPFGEWLRDFLDGLGLTSVTLVADAPMSSRACDYAALDPMRVSKVSLLPGQQLEPQRRRDAEAVR